MLLKKNISLLFATPEKRSEIYLKAVAQGDVPMLQKCWKAGVAAGTKDRLGSTDLVIAAECGHLPAVQQIIAQAEATSPSSFPDLDASSAFYMAISMGHLPVIDFFISAGHMSATTRSRSDTFPMLMAAYHDHPDVITYLHHQGATVDQCDAEGESALYWACLFQNSASAGAILACGGSPDLPNKMGVTPLMLLCGARESEGEDGSSDYPRKMNAAEKEILKSLFAAKVNIHAVAADGRTALQYAVENGRQQMAVALVLKGAGPIPAADDPAFSAKLQRAGDLYQQRCEKRHAREAQRAEKTLKDICNVTMQAPVRLGQQIRLKQPKEKPRRP